MEPVSNDEVTNISFVCCFGNLSSAAIIRFLSSVSSDFPGVLHTHSRQYFFPINLKQITSNCNRQKPPSFLLFPVRCTSVGDEPLSSRTGNKAAKVLRYVCVHYTLRVQRRARKSKESSAPHNLSGDADRVLGWAVGIRYR